MINIIAINVIDFLIDVRNVLAYYVGIVKMTAIYAIKVCCQHSIFAKIAKIILLVQNVEKSAVKNVLIIIIIKNVI